MASILQQRYLHGDVPLHVYYINRSLERSHLLKDQKSFSSGLFSVTVCTKKLRWWESTYLMTYRQTTSEGISAQE